MRPGVAVGMQSTGVEGQTGPPQETAKGRSVRHPTSVVVSAPWERTDQILTDGGPERLPVPGTTTANQSTR